MEKVAEGYWLSLDNAEMQVDAIHTYLSRSYWASSIPKNIVAQAMKNSICCGLFYDGQQIGFARVVSDRATFAYLADVYVLEAHRGRGLSKILVKTLHDHADLQGLRRWMLATRDAHNVYSKLGWTKVPNPEILMQRHFPGIYQ